MPSVIKLAILSSKKYYDKLYASSWRNQAQAQIPVTLYEIITEHRQIREKDKRRVGSSLTAMN